MQALVAHYRRISNIDYAVFLVSEQQAAFLSGRNPKDVMDWLHIWGVVPIYSGLSEGQALIYKRKVEKKVSVDEKRPEA